MYLPQARREGLSIRELGEETLVYDLKSNKAHCLNATSSLVWRHCDGRTTLAELAVMLQRELGLPANVALVQLAVEQLARRGLLQQPVEVLSHVERRSRRDMLKKLGVALAALPLIMSLTAPRAAAQASTQQTRAPQQQGTECSMDFDCGDALCDAFCARQGQLCLLVPGRCVAGRCTFLCV